MVGNKRAIRAAIRKSNDRSMRSLCAIIRADAKYFSNSMAIWVINLVFVLRAVISFFSKLAIINASCRRFPLLHPILFEVVLLLWLFFIAEQRFNLFHGRVDGESSIPNVLGWQRKVEGF